MTLIGFLVPPTCLAWFFAIAFNLAMSTRSTRTKRCDSTTYRIASLRIGGTSGAGRSGRRRVFKPLKGVKHDDCTESRRRCRRESHNLKGFLCKIDDSAKSVDENSRMIPR